MTAPTLPQPCSPLSSPWSDTNRRSHLTEPAAFAPALQGRTTALVLPHLGRAPVQIERYGCRPAFARLTRAMREHGLLAGCPAEPSGANVAAALARRAIVDPLRDEEALFYLRVYYYEQGAPRTSRLSADLEHHYQIEGLTGSSPYHTRRRRDETPPAQSGFAVVLKRAMVRAYHCSHLAATLDDAALVRDLIYSASAALNPLMPTYTPTEAVEQIRMWYWEGGEDDAWVLEEARDELEEARRKAGAPEPTDEEVRAWADENYFTKTHLLAELDDAYLTWPRGGDVVRDELARLTTTQPPLRRRIANILGYMERLEDTGRQLEPFVRAINLDDYVMPWLFVVTPNAVPDLTFEHFDEMANHDAQSGVPERPLAACALIADSDAELRAGVERLAAFLDLTREFTSDAFALLDLLVDGPALGM